MLNQDFFSPRSHIDCNRGFVRGIYSLSITLRAESGELLIVASVLCEDKLWNRVVAALVPL